MAPAFGTVGGRDLPCVIYCFLDVNDKINYLECELTQETGWKISFPNWSAEVNKIAPMGLISYQMDQLGRKYCSVSGDDGNVLIYSISETGILQNIDIKENNKEDATFKYTPISAFPGWLKVNGEDLDFYVETYKSNDSNELVWVHYYQN